MRIEYELVPRIIYKLGWHSKDSLTPPRTTDEPLSKSSLDHMPIIFGQIRMLLQHSFPNLTGKWVVGYIGLGLSS
jgi:hypothetical protein